MINSKCEINKINLVLCVPNLMSYVLIKNYGLCVCRMVGADETTKKMFLMPGLIL